MQKTLFMKREEMGKSWTRDWYVVDAQGKTLGRLASQIAMRLMGKHKPIYTPHVDVGDHIVVINAEKIKVTGKKRSQKIYYRYSGYPGGLRERTFEEQITKHPTAPLNDAIRRMLPRSTLGRRMLKKLNVYAGAEHPHQAQSPKPLEL
jgi:large subunit ribosomal protein L13